MVEDTDLTLEDLRRLSHVARIHLDEAQERRHLDSLNAMLALAQELEELPMHVGNYPVAFTLEEMREDAPLERLVGFAFCAETERVFFSFLTISSSKVFHPSQPGHFPIHLADS